MTAAAMAALSRRPRWERTRGGCVERNQAVRQEVGQIGRRVAVPEEGIEHALGGQPAHEGAQLAVLGSAGAGPRRVVNGFADPKPATGRRIGTTPR